MSKLTFMEKCKESSILWILSIKFIILIDSIRNRIASINDEQAINKIA